MADNYDLEQAIMDCWGITEDLDTVINTFEKFENVPAEVEDEVQNMLIGLKHLYHNKFVQMFDIFENVNFKK